MKKTNSGFKEIAGIVLSVILSSSLAVFIGMKADRAGLVALFGTGVGLLQYSVAVLSNKKITGVLKMLVVCIAGGSSGVVAAVLFYSWDLKSAFMSLVATILVIGIVDAIIKAETGMYYKNLLVVSLIAFALLLDVIGVFMYELPTNSIVLVIAVCSYLVAEPLNIFIGKYIKKMEKVTPLIKTK